MRRVVFVLTTVGLLGSPTALALAGQAQLSPGSPGELAQQPERVMSTLDQGFAAKAAQGGLAEVRLGQLAATRSQNEAVKAFGQRMVQDHGLGNEILQRTAKAINLSLPLTVSAETQTMADRLASLSGPSFDRTYIDHMVMDHEKDIAEFEREANEGTNQELRSYAAQQLPTLREHLALARQIQKQLP